MPVLGCRLCCGLRAAQVHATHCPEAQTCGPQDLTVQLTNKLSSPHKLPDPRCIWFPRLADSCAAPTLDPSLPDAPGLACRGSGQLLQHSSDFHTAGAPQTRPSPLPWGLTQSRYLPVTLLSGHHPSSTFQLHSVMSKSSADGPYNTGPHVHVDVPTDTAVPGATFSLFSAAGL